MSRVLTAKEVCERALRAIGTFPLSESAPDAEQLREAMFWLDLIMAEVAGTRRLLHLIPEPVQFALTPGVSRYPLKSTLAGQYPIDGIQFPVGAWVVTNSGEVPIPIVRRDTWSQAQAQAATGAPRMVYIDRAPELTLYTYPTLPLDAASPLLLQLDFQRNAPNVAPGGVSGAVPQDSTVTGYRQSWQRYLIMRLAMDIGSGPVIKLAEQSLARFERQALTAVHQLDAFENQEHDTEPPITRAFDEPRPTLGGYSPRGGVVHSDALADDDGYYIIPE